MSCIQERVPCDGRDGGGSGRREAARRGWLTGALVTTGVLGVVASVLVSCGTLSRTVVAPPQIPGAEYIGDEDCELCHDVIAGHFATASHARLTATGDNAPGTGCETCHGPGSLHSDAGGGTDNILNPGEDPTICLNCHLDVRSRFMLRSKHPVVMGHDAFQGGLSCADCHSSHQGSALPGGGSLSTLARNEQCLTCHEAQRGPFVFEHEALREGCEACHDPHGSVNEKLLVARNASLCLRCHFQQQAGPGVVLIGGQNHSDFLSRGTCWSSGCHEAIHGSRVSSSLRY